MLYVVQKTKLDGLQSSEALGARLRILTKDDAALARGLD